jgi:peptidyl-prolyl cis-trans isomerase SurA
MRLTERSGVTVGPAIVRATLAALAMAAALGASRPASAEVVERVVAVVNDEAIFLSELRRRAGPFLDRAMSAPSQTARMAAIEALYAQLLERMVQEELFIQAADRMQVSVTRAEVDRAIGNVQRQAGLADADFWAAVEGQGFTPEQYRADVRRQLLRLKVLNNWARNRVNITEEQVRQRYDMSVARQRRSSTYNTDQIFVEIPAGAGATEVAEARARAQAIRDAIETDEDFDAAMAAHDGGNLGWLSQGDLPQSVENVVLALDVGEVSQPVRGPAGFQIFRLRERDQAGAGAPVYADVRMQIYQEMMEEAMTHQEEIFLAELRRQAVVDVRL